MYASVTEYKGWIVFELLVDKSNDEVASSIDRPGNLGQVISNTEKNLGISAEAFALLKTVKNARDAIGDVMFFETNDNAAFGWLGGPKAIKRPENIEGCRATRWDLKYISIPNEPPEGAKEAIDKIDSNPS